MSNDDIIMNEERTPIYITSLGLINALGASKEEVLENLSVGRSPGMQCFTAELLGKDYFCGVVNQNLPKVPEALAKFDCRNNQLAMAALAQIQGAIDEVINQFGANRIGIVMGTSTSGIKEAEIALKAKSLTGTLPERFSYKMQEIGALAEFIRDYLGTSGPCYSISTACSSSGKVFASAERLLRLGLCDAVVVGGADSLCDLTLGGFESLEAISKEQTQPFSVNRKGINIGEAAAMFILSKTPLSTTNSDSNEIYLLGVGEASDAYHISAPEPNGLGAIAAMEDALAKAQLKPEQVDYLNLHGTGTSLNDLMEAKAVNQLFGERTGCSSTKPLTGHTLGAAGATEAALCWLILHNNHKKIVPPHIFDGQLDPDLSKIHLLASAETEDIICTTLSNSFAFGGNNVSVIFGR